MSERRKYRAGDVVRHIELGEEWLLACDEWADRVSACGWPPSWNLATEVELVTPATDEERLQRLRETAAMGCRTRSAQAQAALDAEPQPRRTLADVVANPPEGWKAHAGPLAARFCHELAEVGAYPPHPVHHVGVEVSEIIIYDDLSLKELIVAHRAIADLLDVLAEVSDV